MAEKEAGLQRFADNLVRLLGMHHLTSQQAAELLGYSPQAVSEWLNRKREPNTKTLLGLTATFEVDALRLMSEPFGALLPDLAERGRFERVEQRIEESNVRGSRYYLRRKEGEVR